MGNFFSDITRPFTGKGRQGRSEQREASSANALDDIAKALFAQTDPLRGGTVDTLRRVLAGERPENFRVFAPEREALESQFTRARENVITTNPARGGQLNKMIADLEIARAGGVAGLEADVDRGPAVRGGKPRVLSGAAVYLWPLERTNGALRAGGYLTLGPYVARSRVLCGALRPLFDLAVRRAQWVEG